MKVEDAIYHINVHRQKLNLSCISISKRPSYSAPGKTTIEIKIGDTVASKSVSWGPIAAFLKGMLLAFEEKPSFIGAIGIESPIRGKRKIQWR